MQVLVPIFICVVLPVAIVLIVSLTKINADNKRTEVIIKAIEANNDIDADKLAESMRKPRKSAREILNYRLLRGCIFSFVGLVLVIIGLVSLIAGSEIGADNVTVPMIFGGVSIAVGASYLLVYAVTRRQIEKDCAADRQ